MGGLQTASKLILSIYALIGKGYENGWFTNCYCRYRIFAGARNTKKSYDILGLEVLAKILSNPLRNVMILREMNISNRNSTYATIMRLIHQPDINRPEISLDRYFSTNKNTMTITYRPTGQQIIFDGMNTPSKITSLRMTYGYLTDLYVEEAFEMPSFEQWRMIDGTFRGKFPEGSGLNIQITMCLNTWNKEHWIYKHFFKGRLEDDFEKLEENSYMDFKDENLLLDYGKGLYLHKSTYKINEFRDIETYDEAMEELRRVAPEIYKVEALGMWGNSTSATYPEFSESLIFTPQALTRLSYAKYAIGIDTGLSDGEGRVRRDGRIRSATTMHLVGLTTDYGQICVCDEYFYTNEGKLKPKTEPEIISEIIDVLLNWRNVKYNTHYDLLKGVILVYVDNADIGFRQGLELVARQKGLLDVKFIGSTKQKIQTRVDFERLLMSYGDLMISESAPNLAREIKTARRGLKGEVRENLNDHAINSFEYGLCPLLPSLRRWKDFKGH